MKRILPQIKSYRLPYHQVSRLTGNVYDAKVEAKAKGKDPLTRNVCVPRSPVKVEHCVNCDDDLNVCLHVTKFSPSPIYGPLLFSIVSMNNRQNG